VRRVRLDLADGRALVDLHAEPLDCRGQPAHQLGRMHAGYVRGEDRAVGARDTQSPVELRAAQLAQVLLGEAVLTRARDRFAQAPQLRLTERDVEMAALDEVRFDALLGEDAADLADGREHRPLERGVALAPAPALVHPRRSGEESRDPASVAPRGAEARHLALEHDDLERGIGALEVVGGPQARVAGADDRHVRLGRPGQRRPWRRRAAQRSPPEAELAGPHRPSVVACGGIVIGQAVQSTARCCGCRRGWHP